MRFEFVRDVVLHVSLLMLTCASLAAPAQTTPGSWKVTPAINGRSLTWSSTVPLLGKPTKVSLEFTCDPKSVKDVYGTLGLELAISNAAALKPFSFDDFDGPDATAGADGRKHLELTVTRKGKPPLVIKSTPNGGSHDPNFNFSFQAMSKLPKSEPRTILTALASDDAETLKIVITDPRNAKLKLEVTVPVAGKQADFRTLMTGLK